MNNNYVESVVQDFNDESTAQQFQGMITKYLPSEQVEREGCKVTCHASNKRESWFLTLFVMQVVLTRMGMPLPKEVMIAITKLAADFTNDAVADEIEQLFAAVGLDQRKIIEQISKMKLYRIKYYPMKNSTELIAMAKDIVERELQRSLDRRKQPSFYEIAFEAYMQGLEDGSNIPADTIRKAQAWHYVEIEGVPDNDNRYWILYEYDGKYQETTHGCYEDGRWHLDYHPSNCEYKVLAWHPLPDIND